MQPHWFAKHIDVTLTWAHGHRQGQASSIQGLWPAVALEADNNLGD